MNQIIIELCAEDRARLDRIAELLDKLNAPVVAPAPTADNFLQKEPNVKQENNTPANAPETAPEAPEAPAAVTTQPEEKTAPEAESAKAEDVKPTVTLAQIQQKVVQLAAGFGGAKKAAVREIVNAYAKKVSDLPEDKWTEVWDKLTALESEG